MKLNENMPLSTEESIKKDNKKAGWKFALVLLACVIIGGVIGFVSAMTTSAIGLSGITDRFHELMTGNISLILWSIPVIMMLMIVFISAWCVISIRTCKKKAPVYIETDNEEGIEKLESKLSYVMWGTSVFVILYYLLYSLALYADFKYNEDGPVALLAATSIFMICIILVIVLQQRVVDCMRLMNPEKQGSVYDLNFNKKWEASCDEAEKMMIYKAGYKAYKVVNMLCMVLWVIFMIIGINTGSCFVTVMTVLVIWMVLVCVYSYHTIKYSK